jgi:signal transduction histidine kinase
MSAVPNQLLNAKDPTLRNYGSEDGLESTEGVRRSRSVITDALGQVWMTTAFEVARVGSSPEHMLGAIPQVEEVTADGALLGGNSPKAPAGAKRLTFAFTGLDLHTPSRVRFRYRLDNFDKSWSAVVSDRQATYTNLPPGKYTFRLIASNDSDSWNSPESTKRVEVEPLIWQRWTVRSSAALIIALLAILAYHTRTKNLLAQAGVLADERLRERTRIARDVHDTLLQGFISSLMHLHVAQKEIPPDSPIKNRFTFVLEGMERVIEEARLTVVGLRTPESGHECLEGSLRDFILEIGDLGNAESVLRSSGRARRLMPKAYEDVSSIAREAILNAVRHANARTVRVTIDWGWRRLRLQVSDDGSGIDLETLQHGRAQHWGLASMRERAEQLKAHLSIESDSSSGTRITLSVPSSVAYLALNKSEKTAPTDAE